MISVALIITVLAVILCVVMLFWFIDWIPFPGPVGMILKVIIGVMALLYILQKMPFMKGVIG
jgi:F0F1-type ATP synthase assembly protein I